LERDLLQKLVDWKHSKDRKPLIIEGARQVGKSWLMQKLGEVAYENFALFNFDENRQLDEIFKITKDPKRIIKSLSLIYGQAIEPEKTLIIFDEIQESPEALNSLKYFYESASDYHVICAGSLLGVTLGATKGFPVGKVSLIQLSPLSFTEFLDGSSDEKLSRIIRNKNDLESLPSLITAQLEEKLQQYYLIGGMPEAVNTWASTQNLSKVREVQQMILETYRLDFSKHTTQFEQNKITLVWDSIPSQLAKENKKFIYSIVRKGARARDYEFSVQWIVNAGLLQKVNWNSAAASPLKIYDDSTIFKTYMLDVGLLTCLAGIEGNIILQKEAIFQEFKGGLTENFVCNQIYHQWVIAPRYWTSEKTKAEVNFVIQYQNHIFPIEVKAGRNVRGKSLAYFAEEKKSLLKVRFSLLNLTLDDKLLNIPLYLINRAPELIELALKELYGQDWQKYE
jgi:predicted AAA+ superfamily ATPase